MLNPMVDEAIHRVKLRLMIHSDIPQSAHKAITNVTDAVRDQFAGDPARIIMTNPQTYSDIGRAL